MSGRETDPRLRELAAAIKAARARWNKDPTEEMGRRILALEDAQYARYLEIVRTDLEKAKGATAEARAAVTEAREKVRESRRALASGEGRVDAVLVAEDRLRDARRDLRHAGIAEDVARARLAEAALARWGADALGAAVGLPLSVSVSPSAGPELRDALLGDVT
jgi:hypothetical protein